MFPILNKIQNCVTHKFILRTHYLNLFVACSSRPRFRQNTLAPLPPYLVPSRAVVIRCCTQWTQPIVSATRRPTVLFLLPKNPLRSMPLNATHLMCQSSSNLHLHKGEQKRDTMMIGKAIRPAKPLAITMGLFARSDIFCITGLQVERWLHLTPSGKKKGFVTEGTGV